VRETVSLFMVFRWKACMIDWDNSDSELIVSIMHIDTGSFVTAHWDTPLSPLIGNPCFVSARTLDIW
jgi:hypothetical protein